MKVVFYREGSDVFAVFPEEPGTNDPQTMLCYAHIGQHSYCHSGYLAGKRLASPEEYESLLSELQDIYGAIEVLPKMPSNTVRLRIKALRKIGR